MPELGNCALFSQKAKIETSVCVAVLVFRGVHRITTFRRLNEMSDLKHISLSCDQFVEHRIHEETDK